MRKILKNLIRLYTLLISPFIGVNCRHIPTCSSYACEAIDRYGVFKGIALTLGRLSRCHPFCPGGHDPVP